VVLVSRGDPASLATKGFVANVGSFTLTRVFNATLSFKDEHDQANPYLAQALPTLNTDSWTVSPDGRMTTTWKLRPKLTWHDGAPLTAEDFAFAYRVYARPELGAAQTTPIKQIEGIDAPDSSTVIIHWKQLYADAVVENGGFFPLPEHLLQQSLDTQDPPAFMTNPFWVGDFVGAGPYKLTEYVPGDHLDAAAFDGHALGRPRIDRIRIRFISDAHTAVANLLTGDVHFTDTFVLSPTDGVSLEQRWAADKAGEVMWSPTTIRMALVQWRPEVAVPRALSDLRVRKALAHGFDVASVVETLNYGKGVQTPTITSPTTTNYDQIDRVITRYPYDARQVAQLMDQAGFNRGVDGIYADSSGIPFNVEVSSVGDDKNVQETAFFVDSLKKVGLGATQYVFPPEQTSDAMARALRPGISIRGGGTYNVFAGAEIAGPENRWNGANRSGYQNPAYDRLYDQYNNTIDSAQRVAILAQMEKTITDDVPAVLLYFQAESTAHVSALKGPQNTASPGSGGGVLRIHEWTWQP